MKEPMNNPGIELGTELTRIRLAEFAVPYQNLQDEEEDPNYRAPSIEMSKWEKSFLIYNATRTAISEFQGELEKTGKIKEAIDRLKSIDDHEENWAHYWACLCVDDYDTFHRRNNNSVTPRSELITFFKTAFLRTCVKLVYAFENQNQIMDIPVIK